MIEKPTASEEIFPINDDLSAHYSVFKNGYTYRRPANTWRFWSKLPYVAPDGNPWISANCADGVRFDCAEHVSVAINGTATYTFATPDGPKDYLWERGVHNVDNGMGYLPSEEFTRTFENDFTLCCIVQPFMGRDTTARYSFEVLTGPQALTRDAFAIHFCTGVFAKQTHLDLIHGMPLDIADNDIAIAVYQES